MKRFILMLLQMATMACLLAFSLPARADCAPEPTPPSPELIQELVSKAADRGFLWKISKGGQTSWLYGTIHANRIDTLFPGPKTRAALLGSDALAIEMDISDEATRKEVARLSQRGAGQVPKAYQARLQAQLSQRCMPTEMLNQLHPALLLSAMMVMDARKDGIEPAFGTEMVLMGVAKANQKKLLGLETVSEQMTAILGPDAKVSAAQYEQALALLESGRAREQLIRLVEAWNQSNFPVLESYPTWCECMDTPEDKKAMKRLVDDRNHIIAQRIAKFHRPDQSLFVAVGSLHMVGKMGLPNLLRQQGFSVERVSFD